MFGPSRRILGITAHGCECYLAAGGRLALEAHFAPGQAAEYAAFVASRKGSVFTVLADQLEEDFRQETLPFLRGPARAQLLSRKTAQTYRDTPFHAAASLGRERDGRRDERVQFMALTNAEVLNEWLTPLSAAGIRVDGLVSPPLVAPALLRLIARRIGSRPERLLLVSVNRSGLRQVLVEGDTARFSRLAAIAGSDDDAPAFASECLGEVNKTQQYLVGLRLLPRDARIPTLVLVPPGRLDAWSRPGLLVDAIEPIFLDLDDARRAAGLKTVNGRASDDAARFADNLWIRATQGRRAAYDFAPDWLRESHRVWRGRVGLGLGGLAVCLGGIGFGLERWTEATRLDADTRVRIAAAEDAMRNYERIKRGFPPLPATPEQLRASVTAFEALAARTVSPGALLGAVGRSLAEDPDFRLERLDWQVGDSEAPEPLASAAQASQAAPAAADTKAPLFEVVTLYGSIVAPDRAADPRRDIEAAERTAAHLRRIAGVTVVTTRPPLNLAPNATLTGQAGEDRSRPAGRAAVTIRVSRKVGT